MTTYHHSFAKLWLHRLGNEIYINGTNFLNIDIDKLKNKFKITPLKTYIRMGDDLLDKEEMSEITKISYPDMKKNFRLTIYRIRAGKKAWRKNQSYILLIAKKKHGIPDMPETSIRRRNSTGKCVIEWDKLNQCVRGTGEDFGTQDGQYRTGDVTPWIYYGEKKKGHNLNYLVKHDSYDEISEGLFDKWQGKLKRKIQIKPIKELPIMITEEGYLLCLPKTRVLPMILIIGKRGKGKCEPKGSKVLMADGTWKNIEDIKVSDVVVSPVYINNKWRLTNSIVSAKFKYKKEQIFEITDKNDKPKYRCTEYHRIPVVRGKAISDFSADRIYTEKNNKKLSFYLAGKKIKQIEIKLKKKRKKEDVYGISIDSPSQYYITDNWMVTHNSYTLNSILGRVIYIYQDRAGLLNDSLNQFYDLMMPMPKGHSGLIKELFRIGNESKYLPVINLYMSCPGLKMKYTDENIGYRLVIPFKDFLYRYKFFTYKIPKWDLGKPEKYLKKEIVNALDECKNEEDVKRKLFSLMHNAAEDKGTQAMIYKWVAAFESIFRDEFTSNLFKNEETTAPYWELKTKDESLHGHPFIISMEAGLVPVINNYLAKANPIAEKQMADLLKKIIRWQMVRDEKKKRYWIFIDELKDFLGKRGTDVYDALDYLFTQSRINKIGFVGNIQEYKRLSPSMRANSTHLIIFELQTNEERTAVAKDYRLDKEKLDSIAELKLFQCLFTTKERVVLYDNNGRRKEAEGGIWKGKVIPPLSHHSSP